MADLIVAPPANTKAKEEKKRKRAYDASFKLMVVAYAETTTIRGAAKKYGVDGRRVRDWKRQKTELQSLPSEKCRLKGGGRKALHRDVKGEATARNDDSEAIANNLPGKAACSALGPAESPACKSRSIF